MNNKNLALMRKEFKLDSYALPIKEVYSVYLKKDNGKIITEGKKLFDLMDTEEKQLYLNNFKKALTGTIDSKIFELTFNDKSMMQALLCSTLNNKMELQEFVDSVVNRIRENFNYDTDIVINLIKSEYYRAVKDSKDDYVSAFNFILCTINKVEIPKKVLKFDYSQMDFKANSSLDVTVNLNSPLDAFMYPGFDDENYMDTDKLVYYSHKAEMLNNTFVNDVMECKLKATAADEMKTFKYILQEATENKISPTVLQNIYEDLYDKSIDDEDKGLNYEDVKKLFEDNFINTESLKDSFDEVCGGDYTFKPKNIIPDFSNKSVKIQNDIVEVNIVPGHLNLIKQIKDSQGRKCINLILNEDALIDGLNLETENLNL